MRRWLPTSLLGQLALLILLAFLSAQAISAWLFADERGQAIHAAQRFETTERAATVAHALAAAPAEMRDIILEAANSRLVRFGYSHEPELDADEAEHNAARMRIIELLGADPSLDVRTAEALDAPRPWRHGERPMHWLHERMEAAGVGPGEMRISIPLPDGAWLNVSSRFRRPGFQVAPAVLGTMLLSLTLLMAALWLGLRRITGPLRRLAAAADGFGLDSPPPEMPRDGPEEVRALSEALARMHDRLAGMMADRTRMLAALGHDLRSPITALRLRAEMVEDEETRERMILVLDEMQQMVESTLAYARGVSADQPTEPVDLAALLGELARELSETGPEVSLTATAPAVLTLRRMPIRRALRNLLENAQRYGGATEVALALAGPQVRILIEDRGPGIPEADLERVFDPFTRLETSRSRETGGSGLGLPIARAILRAHGGDVSLANRPGGGTRATVTLPLTDAGGGDRSNK